MRLSLRSKGFHWTTLSYNYSQWVEILVNEMILSSLLVWLLSSINLAYIFESSSELD